MGSSNVTFLHFVCYSFSREQFSVVRYLERSEKMFTNTSYILHHEFDYRRFPRSSVQHNTFRLPIFCSRVWKRTDNNCFWKACDCIRVCSTACVIHDCISYFHGTSRGYSKPSQVQSNGNKTSDSLDYRINMVTWYDADDFVVHNTRTSPSVSCNYSNPRLLLITLPTAYTFAYLSLKRQLKEVFGMDNSSTGNVASKQKRILQQKNFLISSAGIVLFSLVTCAPFAFHNYEQFSKDIHYNLYRNGDELGMIFWIILNLNLCTDPFIYCLRIPQYRHSCAVLLCGTRRQT